MTLPQRSMLPSECTSPPGRRVETGGCDPCSSFLWKRSGRKTEGPHPAQGNLCQIVSWKRQYKAHLFQSFCPENISGMTGGGTVVP